MADLLSMFLISLVLTLVIETLVALPFGVRLQGLKVVWLVNILTNPTAVCVNWLIRLRFPELPLLVRQLPIEGAAILVEALIYRWFADSERVDIPAGGSGLNISLRKDRWGIHYPFALAIVANLVSYCAGLLLR